MSQRFVILTWHAIHVVDNTYAGNDLLAFASDLHTLDALGYRIWPLARALTALDEGTLPPKVVVLTADDGPILDFEEFEHPTCGPQQSLYARLRAFIDSLPADHAHRPHLSSFAIASPQARSELDRKDYRSLDVWHERWWPAATASGMIAIENHSWDHNHASLETTCQRDNRKGDFRTIDTAAECRLEIDQASAYIARQTGRKPQFFAYPYGHGSDYLRQVYLPENGPRLGLRAALAVNPEPVTPNHDRWYLPRYMCGCDWQSPEALEALLRDA